MKDLKIKVGAIGLLDMLKFKNQVKTRDKQIDSGKAETIKADFKTNQMAAEMHPKSQKLKICQIIEHNKDVKTIVFGPVEEKTLAYFRAGQYLSFSLEVDGSKVTRPISICSSPKESLQGRYAITVKRAGFASDYILDQWKTGDIITASEPLGNFYYSGMRDAEHVIGLAGGSGITPFLSMASAIVEGTEKFKLTLLYGSRKKEDILFFKELKKLEKDSCGKVRVVHVLSDEKRDEYEHGFLTEKTIRKYMKPGNNSFFICGPQAMYNFVAGELQKIVSEQKWVRRELFGASKSPWELPGYPQECRNQKYQVKMRQAGKEFCFEANANESLLIAIERSAILAPSRCRSGECGWCRSRLIEGKVFIPDDTDGRRMADKQYGYIHPCVSYPISDVTIEIPNV